MSVDGSSHRHSAVLDPAFPLPGLELQWRSLGLWRLVSGLVLFSFAATHFLNHALGIVSLEWMLTVQGWRRELWRSWPGTSLLVAAFSVHVGLSLWKLATRRTWRMPWSEALQIILGLAIPVLGAGHVVNTRVMHELYGFDDNYAVVLNAIWSTGGWRQSLLLLVVWFHGIIGIRYWMRGKPWFPRWSHVFWIAAVLIPSLALSGWVEGARQVGYGIAQQQSLAPAAERAKQNVYTATHMAIWLVFILLAVMIVVARLMDWFRAGPVITFPGGRRVQAPGGATLLEISRYGGAPFTAACGGRGRCTTCRVLIAKGADTLPPPRRAEMIALERMRSPPGVRLACQIRPIAPLTVRPLVPVEERVRGSLDDFEALHWGVERKVTIMFVDLRGFTALAERLYPFDSVFVLNRFFEIMGSEVERHHGIVDKYLGDGFMALFGIRGLSHGNGSRNAILAAYDMLKALDAANEEFRATVGEALRMGIGIHTGRAVLGHVGDQRSGTVTALGDSVNIAARLEALNKDFDSKLIVSDATLMSAGLATEGWESRQVELRGRDGAITIHVARTE